MSETTSETGALTVDAAIAALTPTEPVEQEAPEEPIEAAEEPIEAAEEPVESEGEDQAPDDAEAEVQDPDEAEEAEAESEAVEPADPPKYWSKDAKEAFGKLPPDLQAVVLAQEGPREEAAAKAKAEASEIRQQAEAELGKVTKLAQGLAEFLPQAIETFQNRWGSDPDWLAYAHEHGAEAMTLAKAQHDAELGQLQKLNAAKQEAGEQAFAAYVSAETAKLAEIEPDLADPETGVERRQKIVQHIVSRGVDPDSIRHISAAELSIAYDAMRWRDAQKALKAAPKPQPKPVPKAAPVRPAAAQAGTPQQRTSNQAVNRFAQTRSVDDAVAVLLAKG